eukprot:TRINITY_DN20997_c0_g1_i2.p1 TRINITY_DN20997_c0_g1~~TRINITY_DN20997_c0_g1_i2.p1  ORF type:complete len:509 (+),score=213.88 TRINITY_DN20997_c0_g1_i2:213-1739(+)
MLSMKVHWADQPSGCLLPTLAGALQPTVSDEALLQSDRPPSPQGPAVNARALLVLGAQGGDEHLLRRIRIVAGKRKAGTPVAYGGVVDASSDASIQEGLVSAVQRQCGLDLSAVQTWTKLAEVSYDAEQPTPDTLFLMPDLSEAGPLELHPLLREEEEEVEEEAAPEPAPAEPAMEEAALEDQPAEEEAVEPPAKRQRITKQIKVVEPHIYSLHELLETQAQTDEACDLAVAVDSFDEWLKRDCSLAAGKVLTLKGAEAREKEAKSRELAERRQARKRQRDEEAEVRKGSRDSALDQAKAVKDAEAAAAKEEFDAANQALQAEWEEEDQGKTEDDILACKPDRDEQLKELSRTRASRVGAAAEAYEQVRKAEADAEKAAVDAAAAEDVELYTPAQTEVVEVDGARMRRVRERCQQDFAAFQCFDRPRGLPQSLISRAACPRHRITRALLSGHPDLTCAKADELSSVCGVYGQTLPYGVLSEVEKLVPAGSPAGSPRKAAGAEVEAEAM